MAQGENPKITRGIFSIERAGICALNHLEAHQNANGEIKVWLDCPHCSDEMDCQAVARLVQKRVNLRSSVEAIVGVK